VLATTTPTRLGLVLTAIAASQGQPTVVQGIPGRNALVRIRVQHGSDEADKVSGLVARPAVLVHQGTGQFAGLQVFDVPKLAIRLEDLRRVFATLDHATGKGSTSLDNGGNVGLIQAGPSARLLECKQIIAGDHFPEQAGSTPNVRGLAVAGPKDHLHGPVLSGLYVVGEVVMEPTAIAHVGNLHIHLTELGGRILALKVSQQIGLPFPLHVGLVLSLREK